MQQISIGYKCVSGISKLDNLSQRIELKTSSKEKL